MLKVFEFFIPFLPSQFTNQKEKMFSIHLSWFLIWKNMVTVPVVAQNPQTDFITSFPG